MLDLSLDKKIEPLSVDTKLSVRPRSALGLKYVELIPGRAKKTFQAGDTIPLAQRHPERARARGRALDLRAARRATTPASRSRASATPSPAAARRSTRSIETLEPFTALPAAGDAQPVRPEDRADAASSRARRARRRRSRRWRRCRRCWFTDMADTFAAISREPEALRETIEESPPTLDGRDRVVPRPDAVPGPLRRPLARPPAGRRASCRARCRSINSALQAGVAGLPRDAGARARTSRTCSRRAEDLGDNPNTLLALKDLRTARAR